MEDKNFNFAKTRDALSQLSADVIELNACIKKKQAEINDYKQNLEATVKNKNDKLAALDQTLQNALVKIEQINRYIEETL